MYNRAGEMVELLRACTALAGDFSSVPNTHARQIHNPCNSNSGGSDALFWFLQALYLGALHMYAPPTHPPRKNAKQFATSRMR